MPFAEDQADTDQLVERRIEPGRRQFALVLLQRTLLAAKLVGSGEGAEDARLVGVP